MIKISSLVLFIAISLTSYSQVGIGTTMPKGALDIESSTNGIVIPRVGLNDVNQSLPITNPNGGNLVIGTLVFNTTNSASLQQGFYYWDGSKWVAMNSVPTTPIPSTSNAPIIHSVKGNSDISTNSNSFVDMSGMIINFTPTKNRVYVTVSVAGEISTNYLGQIYGQISLLVNNVAVAGTKFVATDYDEDSYGDINIVAGWNAQISMFPVDVIPGQNTTIKLQWNRGASSWYSSNSNAYITNPASSKKTISHRSLIIFE